MKNCPYDNTTCDYQTKRVKEWVDAVEYMAANKVNHVFYSSPTMFDNCDRSATCPRYILWLNEQKQQKSK